MRLEPSFSRTCTASRSAVHKFSPASRRRASAAAAARASSRLSVMVATSRASGENRLRSEGLASVTSSSWPMRRRRRRSASRMMGRMRNQRTIRKVTPTISTTKARARQKLCRHTEAVSELILPASSRMTSAPAGCPFTWRGMAWSSHCTSPVRPNVKAFLPVLMACFTGPGGSDLKTSGGPSWTRSAPRAS